MGGFKEFLTKSNALALAIGVIIGASLGALVTTLVNAIIMPPIGWVLNGVDFASMKTVLGTNAGLTGAWPVLAVNLFVAGIDLWHIVVLRAKADVFKLMEVSTGDPLLKNFLTILKPGGIFQGTMLSKRNAGFGLGAEVAPDTFVREPGHVRTTVAYHRCIAHKTAKLHPVVKHILIFLAITNGSGNPLSWAAYHRLHHAKSDTPEDISSPGVGGFWWAHLRWLYQSAPPNTRSCMSGASS